MAQRDEVIRIADEVRRDLPYENHVLTQANDHVCRVATMTEPYVWHHHPGSDETFLVVEGELAIDFEDRTVALRPGEMLTVRAGVRHRTRPLTERTVNLTFEKADAQTVLEQG